MKKVLFAFAMMAVLAVPALATGSGGINIGYPTLQIGYTSQDWTFQQFAGTPALFSLQTTNLQSATNAVKGDYLNGTNTVTKQTVSGTTTLAILNHASTFVLFPTKSTSPFPSIWVKGTDVNPAEGGTDVSAKPSTWLSGTATDVGKFYQTGLTIQAPYWDAANYQWTVYVYADKDILSQTAGAAGGTILDPRDASMRWFAWTDDVNGIAKKQWGIRKAGETSATMFNTLPLIATASSAAVKKAFLIGTTGASLPPNDAEIPGVAEASIPADGSLKYNTDRNTVSASNANGMNITARSQVGLVYAAPNSAASHRTENLHMQFIVTWPEGLGLGAGSKSCDINIYQRTTL